MEYNSQLLNPNSIPTRRSSDLAALKRVAEAPTLFPFIERVALLSATRSMNGKRDRKSTRLNSSHVEISYAVFCLKKKNNESNYHILLSDLYNKKIKKYIA